MFENIIVPEFYSKLFIELVFTLLFLHSFYKNFRNQIPGQSIVPVLPRPGHGTEYQIPGLSWSNRNVLSLVLGKLEIF